MNLFHSLRTRLFKLTAYRLVVATGLAFTVFHLWQLRGGADLTDTPVIGRLEGIFHDLKFRERGSRPPSGKVVVGAADEKAVRAIGRWPFPRDDWARIITNLTEKGARAIVFDVAFSDRAFDGEGGSSKKLALRFGDASLATGAGEELVASLSRAATDAKGAAELLPKVESTSLAARDLKVRLATVPATLDAALAVLERYQSLHREFGEAVKEAAGTRGADEILGDAVRASGRVVLGSFLITQEEADQMDAKELEVERGLLGGLALARPSLFPVDLGSDDEVVRERSVPLVPTPNFHGARAPLEVLLRGKAGDPVEGLVGFFNATPDPDGVIRRTPLFFRVGDKSTGTLLPGIDLAGLLRFHDASPAWVKLWAGNETGELESLGILPQSAARPSDQFAKLGDFLRFPLDPHGRLLLNYYGPFEEFPSLSLADAWNGTLPKEAVDGKVIVVGAVATGTYDQRVTPFNPIVAGVATHATAMENLISGNYLLRPWWATAFELAILLALAFVVGRLIVKVRVVVGVPLTVLAMVAYHAFDYSLFVSGYAVFSALPLLELVSIYVVQTVFRYSTEEREKAQIRRAFQFYLTKSVMEEMLQDPSKLKLGGDKKVLSVMFSDIRGFTTISEKLSPEQLAKLINDYLTPMTDIVFKHGGTLDKYIGDAVMAIWGAPVAQEDHALRSCRAAMEMMRELAALQERWRMEGMDYPPIDIGIGINSGPMVVGNMGANQRFDYTVLGDNVNLASRLEGTNKDYRSHVIISQSTYDMCSAHIAARELGAVRVKGKKEPVKIYELLDDKPAAGELAQVIALFDGGIAHFRTQEWEAARGKFRSVLAQWPKDGPAQAYIEFCDEYEKEPPGAEWDGVYTMTHK